MKTKSLSSVVVVLSIVSLSYRLVRCGNFQELDSVLPKLNDFDIEKLVETDSDADKLGSGRAEPWPAKTLFYINHQAVIDECVWYALQNLRLLEVTISSSLDNWRSQSTQIDMDFALNELWNKYFLSSKAPFPTTLTIIRKMIDILNNYYVNYISKLP